MNYSESFDLLNTYFNQKDPEIVINEAELIIKNYSFNSERKDPFTGVAGAQQADINDTLFSIPDQEIGVNNNFRYSVFLNQRDDKKHERVILMLHGLNERKWSKYLPWATSILKNTGIPVVIFPISFHMNRSPEEWSNPRLLLPIVKEKIEKGRVDSTTTIANYALSERLYEVPERFFLSGYQSINDVVKLIKEWKEGRHPLFSSNVKIDFFSYSIGAFLTEVMMIANPEGLLNDSKFFFFCGGSVFSEMNATSRFILNKQSFERIYQFYVNDIENEVVKGGKYVDILNFSEFGKAFRAMLAPNRFQQIRDRTFNQFAKKIQAIALTKDAIVPSQGIRKTLGEFASKAGTMFEEIDFEFPYSHENPFDAKLTKFARMIDEGFDLLFGKAANFLAKNN